MALKCPSCGGSMFYNIELAKMECSYCGTSLDVKEYSKSNEAKKSDVNSNGLIVDTYLCKNCGAELSAPEEQVVSYCQYCGGEATLMQKSEETERPAGIVPFKVSKNEVMEKYKATLSKMSHCPKEFSNPEFIEGFRGIYIPYWQTSVVVPPTEATLSGETYTTQGRYDITRYYDYKLKVSGVIETGGYDASESFDDTIAAEIAPFYDDDLEPFNEGYLGGFYADKSTVEVEKYKTKIDEKFYDEITSEIANAGNGITCSRDTLEESIIYSEVQKETNLFPIWFLTWKKGNRVAYSVMNGQTGKLSMDVPVDYKSFFKTSLLWAAILFAVLSIFPSFIIPLKIAAYTSILMIFSSFLLRGELRNIRQREKHVFDLGSSKVKKKKSKKMSLGFFMFLFWLYIAWTGVNSFLLETTADLMSIYKKITVIQGILTIMQLREVFGVKNKIGFISILLCMLVPLAGLCICGSGVQHDYYYYGLSIAALSGMIMNSFTSLYYMNYLTTRPVPNFFSREGGKNGRK